ncbi:hypothetical protein TNCV_2960301 [Trichonephila clavipes]|nr:hypothetical protein TNCV_2960301 [Trichonephila clavipes]
MVPGLENMVGVALYPIQAVKALKWFESVHLLCSMILFVPSDDALQKRIISVTFEKRIADVNAATQISLCEHMENPFIELRG